MDIVLVEDAAAFDRLQDNEHEVTHWDVLLICCGGDPSEDEWSQQIRLT